MRVCATYGSVPGERSDAPMEEFRLDVFDELPGDIGRDDIIALCGRDASLVPEGFEGLVDAEESEGGIPFRRIRSVHDFERTPEADAIAEMLSVGGQEISKLACRADSFSDLHRIYLASEKASRRHVLIGMGEIGTVTRLRPEVLGNEFTFGYVGEPTAPGQLPADEMMRLGDGCTVVGVTGNPLGHTRSPAMQNAAISQAGIAGICLRFPSPDLGHFADAVREYRIRGMNVTMPYKEEVMGQLDRIDAHATEAGAVNTVVNDGGRLTGYSTDGYGVEFAFSEAGRPLEDHPKVLVFGSGGAARSAVYAAMGSGCETCVLGRNAEAVKRICSNAGAEVAGDRSVEGYDAVINCTPVGMGGDSGYMFGLDGLREGQTVMDCVYSRKTALVRAAESKGCRIASGLDMLVGQGARSFELWFGKGPDTRAMRGAIS